MKKSLEERDLRLRDLVKRERVKIMRKEKRARRAGLVSADVPVLFNQFRDEEWARQLREKINGWNL
jgi:hypothetical protein